MARLFRTGDLIRRIRNQAELNDGGSVQDEELIDNLSSHLAELWSTLDDGGYRWREARQHFVGADMQAASDTDDASEYGSWIALPADHQTTLGVDVKVSRWCRLVELECQDRNDFSASGSFPDAWEHRNDRLYIFSSPTATQQLRHVYIPQPPVLTDTTDEQTFDVFIPAGELFLVWSGVADVKDKNDEDYRYAVEQRERARERVMVWAVKRSRGPRTPHVFDEYYEAGRASRLRRGGEYDY